MNWHHREPTLEDILSDPIVEAVMAADGVDPHSLRRLLRQVGGDARPARARRAAAAIEASFIPTSRRRRASPGNPRIADAGPVE